MAEYIDREVAKDVAAVALYHATHEENYTPKRLFDALDDIPAADVQPVVRGRWKWSEGGQCSECGFHNSNFGYNYCPNCGAKMDDKDINVPCKTKRERNRCLSLSSLQKQNEEMQEVANKDAFYGEALND